jgi:hypothetical protein
VRRIQNLEIEMSRCPLSGRLSDRVRVDANPHYCTVSGQAEQEIALNACRMTLIFCPPPGLAGFQLRFAALPDVAAMT